jgi:hypothetical protein
MIPRSSRIWSVTCLWFAGLLMLTTVPRASAQLRNTQSGAECLEKLEVPNYPALPRQARIQGTLTVEVQLSDRAAVQSVRSTFKGNDGRTNELFAADAERAIRDSRFSRACVGRSVTLIFHYEFRETEGPLFTFAPPNEFWIRSAPVPVNP